MTYTPIAPGTLNWDVPVNAAFVDQDTRITTNTANTATLTTRANQTDASSFMAADAGWLAWNYDPALTAGSTGLTTGQLFMCRVDLAAPATISTLYYAVNTVGVTLTAGQNLAGLYDASGNLLAQTADQSASWISAGFKSTALITPYVAAAGTYHLGFLSNGSTPMSLLRALGSGTQAVTVNANLSATAARWATTGAALTALPSTITMSGRTLSGGTPWVAVG